MRSRSSTARATNAEAIKLVASCLALVRPAGMTADEATEFLAVAAGEVAEYPPAILAEACRLVRRTATHHSQLVPALVARCHELLAIERFLARERPATPASAARAPAPPLRQRDVDRLPPVLVRLGLALGYLVEDRGKVRLAPELKGRR